MTLNLLLIHIPLLNIDYFDSLQLLIIHSSLLKMNILAEQPKDFHCYMQVHPVRLSHDQFKIYSPYRFSSAFLLQLLLQLAYFYIDELHQTRHGLLLLLAQTNQL